MKYLVLGLALITGGFMFADGIHVLVKGKYIGPEKPGPWADLLSLIGVDVFRLGPLFVMFGLAWLVFAVSFWMDASWARSLGILLSIGTLWYLPIGTIISIVVLVMLVFFVRS